MDRFKCFSRAVDFFLASISMKEKSRGETSSIAQFSNGPHRPFIFVSRWKIQQIIQCRWNFIYPDDSKSGNQWKRFSQQRCNHKHSTNEYIIELRVSILFLINMYVDNFFLSILVSPRYNQNSGINCKCSSLKLLKFGCNSIIHSRFFQRKGIKIDQISPFGIFLTKNYCTKTVQKIL